MRIISKHIFFLRKANALSTDDNGYRVFVIPSRLPIIQYSNHNQRWWCDCIAVWWAIMREMVIAGGIFYDKTQGKKEMSGISAFIGNLFSWNIISQPFNIFSFFSFPLLILWLWLNKHTKTLTTSEHYWNGKDFLLLGVDWRWRHIWGL